MDQAIQLITQFGTKLSELAVQVGPEVFALAMSAIVVAHLGKLLTGFIMVAFGGVGLYMAFRCFRKGVERSRAGRDGSGYVFGVVIFGSVGGVVFCVGLFEHVLNIWNWAALYDPRLVVAKRVLGL